MEKASTTICRVRWCVASYASVVSFMLVLQLKRFAYISKKYNKSYSTYIMLGIIEIRKLNLFNVLLTPCLYGYVKLDFYVGSDQKTTCPLTSVHMHRSSQDRPSSTSCLSPEFSTKYRAFHRSSSACRIPWCRNLPEVVFLAATRAS